MNSRYKQELRKLKHAADGLGLGIDAGILHAVAVFNAIGLKTRASCEGHLDRGLPYAWIDFGESTISDDLEQPPEFLTSFIADIHGLAKKYSGDFDFGLDAFIDKDDVRYTVVSSSDGHQRLYAEDTQKTTMNANEQANLRQAKLMLKLLDDYYATHPTPYSHMITIDFFVSYSFRLQPMCDTLIVHAPKSQQRQLQKDYLKRINDFADFALAI